MINDLKRIIRIIGRKIIDLKYLAHLPDNYTVEDIYIVSFPKSGNTWLRFLIANAIKVHFKIEREVNFFTIQDIIPGISYSKSIRNVGPFGRTDLPRILTSHSQYNKYFGRVLFLVRDPRDVLVSYYYHLKRNKSIPDNLTLSQFIRRKDFGLSAWLSHTKSWLIIDRQISGQNIQIIRYEDLHSNTYNQLKRIMELLGLNLEKSELEKAILLSSFDNMRKLEIKTFSEIINRAKEIPFVRKGQVSKGIELSNKDKSFIENKAEKIMKICGYLV